MVFSKYGPIIKRLQEVASTRPFLPPAPRSRTYPSLTTLDPPEGYQRSALYRAERRLNYSISAPWVFQDLAEMELYCTAVLSRASVQYNSASYPFMIRYGTDGRATYQAGVLTVPGAVRQTTLLHELAHHLAPPNSEHGTDFIEAYVFLLRQEMGVGIAQKLLDGLA